MAASGNSVAIKSFQSYTINAGLLAKVVEAVKAGEKDARTSGDIKSFEIFYSGFRQNIAIGRIFIVPVKVCNNFKNFPIALLYGTVVRELNLGEEVADLIEKKIGETEFDEYSQLDVQRIKDTLFKDAESEEYRSLVLFAPNWSNIREYIVFKFTGDDEKLSNLLRHQIFSAYFNPAVSGAFDALMTTVDTNKLDLTDITPKLTYPFITENPLKAYPDLQKTGGWSKPKVFLTAKTADAITKEVLDPQELNVFEALDSALTEVTYPETTSMEEVGDFKGPSGHNESKIEIPEVDAEATLIASAGDGTEMRRRPDYGEKGSYTQQMNEENSKTAAKFDYNATECPDCGSELDAWKVCPATSTEDLKKNQQFCGRGHKNVPNIHLWTGEAPHKDIKHEAPQQNRMVGSAKKADTADNPANENGGEGAIEVKTDKEIAVTAANFDRNAVKCPDCDKDLDAFKMCRDAKGGSQFCGKPGEGSPNLYLGDFYAPQKDIKREPESKARRLGADKAASTWMDDLKKKNPKLYVAYQITGNQPRFALVNMVKALSSLTALNTPEDEKRLAAAKYILRHGKEASVAPFETPFTNVGPGTNAAEAADSAIAVKVDTVSQKGDVKENSPIGIELDETGLPVHEKIAREIWRGVDDNGGYVAMSTKAKAAAAKNEAELNKKYANRKKADVALTEESIWDDITEDFGAAPQVELPGEGSSDSKSTESLPEAMTSEKPEEAKAVTEKEIEKADPESKEEDKSEESEEPKADRPKSKMFGKDASLDRYDVKEIVDGNYMLLIDGLQWGPSRDLSGAGDAEFPTEQEAWQKADELEHGRKGASSKTALLYMNDYDIEMAKQLFDNDPVLGPAIRFLAAFKEEVDSHSDGWAYWKAPVQAAAQLMTLIQAAEKARREGKSHGITIDSLKKAMAPIKAFMTRRGLAAGMQMPKLAVKKNAAEVQPDVAEAKSEVVSPDTVDDDIKQPTESVAEAAKVGTVGVQPVKVVNPEALNKEAKQYEGEHGCRTYVGKAPNGKVCMKPEVVIHDGRKYCEEHRPAESKKKKADLTATPKGRGFGNYVRGEEIHDFSNVHTGDLLLEHSNQFDAGNTILVTKDQFPEAPDSRIWAHFVNPEDWEERWGEDFCIWAHELGKNIQLWRAGNTPEFSEADKIGLNGLGVKNGSKKKADNVSGDISEAKSEVVSPDTVDADIKQPTESVEEAAKVASTPEAVELAKRLIESGDDIAYDVAANNGQIFGNVKQMPWFVNAVADEIEGEEETVREYLDNKDANEAEEIMGDEPAEDLEEHYAAAGDDNDEAVEMGLGDGDLADLAANLPSQDVIFTHEDEKVITASSKTAATYYELSPAYGRDYKTKAEVLQAWNEGKDFEGDFQLGFKPVNINDIPKPCNVLLRYKRNMNVVSVNVK